MYVYFNLIIISLHGLFIGSTGLPLGTQPPVTVPGSTATTTIAPVATTNTSLPVTQLPTPQTPNNFHGAPSIASSLDTTSNVLSTNVVPPPSQPAKLKKGKLHKISLIIL